jgi:hypothetical protein
MAVAVAACSEGTGLAGRLIRSAGPDSSRRLGVLLLVVSEASGSGLNILPPAAGVVVGEASAAGQDPTFPTWQTLPTWWTTWSAFGLPTSSRAEEPTMSLFATGQGVALRRRCWKRRHLAGSCSDCRTGLAAAAVPGPAGIRPFLPVSRPGWVADTLARNWQTAGHSRQRPTDSRLRCGYDR